MEANGIPHTPLEARRSLRVGLVRDIFDTVTRSKECFLNNFQLPASHLEPLFNTRHLEGLALSTSGDPERLPCLIAHRRALVPRAMFDASPSCLRMAPVVNCRGRARLSEP